MKTLTVLFILSMVTALVGCGGGSTSPEAEAHQDAKAAAAPTNRIDIPPAVRTNLGITFAKVERRDVASTVRVPGKFELLPAARREYRTPMSGRVDLLVQQYQAVEPGTMLYRLDSPQWRQMQRELSDIEAAIDLAQARLVSLEPLVESHRQHAQGLRESVDLWSARVKQLEELRASSGISGGDLIEAQSNLTSAKAALGEVTEQDAELVMRRAELESELRSGEARRDLLLHTVGTLLDLPVDKLAAPADGSGTPLWGRAQAINVRAAMPGVVDDLNVTNGGWAGEGELVISVINPEMIRFRAIGLQSDLGRLKSGLNALIVPPQGGVEGVNEAIPTTVQLGLHADADRRTIDLLALPSRLGAWTRPGVSAFLEVALDETPQPELAIPLSAVVRDGLTPIIFRRDPANGDRAIRLEADLGINDGRWVVINSGVKEGDEVVVNGAYQLLLATAGNAPKGGHFHSDGTFHEGEDK